MGQDGASEGDPKKLPALSKFTLGWQLGKPDLVVKMDEAYTVPAEGRDIYRSFVIPLNLTENKWLKAMEFRPGAPSVVHHSLFRYDTTGRAPRLMSAVKHQALLVWAVKMAEEHQPWRVGCRRHGAIFARRSCLSFAQRLRPSDGHALPFVWKSGKGSVHGWFVFYG